MKENTICYGCLAQAKPLKNNYCSSCIKNLFDTKVPNKLNFSKADFNSIRVTLSGRMSISGVQDKISLKFSDNGKDLEPTTENGKYILKPIPNIEQAKNKEDMPANEHLSMLISKYVFKINTAECGLVEFSDGELAYITKRFDYDEVTKEKYDQEDFASLLGVSSTSNGPNYKYDAANYFECAMMIKEHVSASKITIEDFFKRILLNYLILNGDAHLKNFSLHSRPDKADYLLAPNYDLLNTRYHIDEAYGDMALELLDDYTKAYEAHGYYTQADFKEFARYIELPDKRYEKIMDQVKQSYLHVEAMVNSSFLSDKGKEYYFSSYMDRLKRIGIKPQ